MSFGDIQENVEERRGNRVDELFQRIDSLEEKIDRQQDMIRSLYNRARLSAVVSAIKWAVIIGLSLGTFYYLAPMLDTLTQMYSKAASIKGGASGQVLDLLKGI
jgi:hypothetical protein